MACKNCRAPVLVSKNFCSRCDDLVKHNRQSKRVTQEDEMRRRVQNALRKALAPKQKRVAKKKAVRGGVVRSRLGTTKNQGKSFFGSISVPQALPYDPRDFK